MNPNNYEKVQRLMSNLQTAQRAKENIYKYYTSKDLSDCDGGVAGSEKSIYGFFISEYANKSGTSIDLTGVGIGVEIIRFTEKLLEKRIEELSKEIETL